MTAAGEWCAIEVGGQGPKSGDAGVSAETHRTLIHRGSTMRFGL
jgi:hypothetical protein